MDNRCECVTWARAYGELLTDHHPQCPKSNVAEEAARLIRSLTDAMREWGAWEDGIPEKFWPIYEEACGRIGSPIGCVTPPPTTPTPPEPESPAPTDPQAGR